MNLFGLHESWTSELLSRYVCIPKSPNSHKTEKNCQSSLPTLNGNLVPLFSMNPSLTYHPASAGCRTYCTRNTWHGTHWSCSGDGVVCQGGPRRGHRPSSHTRWLKYWLHRPNMRPPGRIICEQRKGKINDVTLKYNNRKYNSRIARCHSRVSQSILIVIKSTTKELRIMCRYNYFSINGRWNLLTQKS